MIEEQLRQHIWTPFYRAVEVFTWLSNALNALGTVWILGLVLLICADVVGRSLFGNPIAGVPEMVSLSIVGIVFLQLASTLRAGRMTRSDVLLNLLGKRFPGLGFALELLFDLAGACIVFVIVRASYPRFLTSLERNEFVGVVGHFTAPTWPIKLIVLLGAGALAVQYLIHAIMCAVVIVRPVVRETDDRD